MRFPIASRSVIFTATLAVAALSTVLAAPTVARAQTYYSDLTSFHAAATTNHFYDFESIVPSNDFLFSPPVVTIPAAGRITFLVASGLDGGVLAMGSEYFDSYYTLNGTDSIAAGMSAAGGGNFLATTIIRLDNLYTAFATEIGQSGNASNSYTIGLYNGNTQVGTDFATGLVGDYFYGVTTGTADAAFDNIRILTGYAGPTPEYTLFDNAYTGAFGVVVPEASTLALALPALGMIGMIGTVAVTRKRK